MTEQQQTSGQNPDQDAGPPGNGITDQQGPHPDPPPEGAEDEETSEAGDDDVDENSKLSFPTSDPPATWAGEDTPS